MKRAYTSEAMHETNSILRCIKQAFKKGGTYLTQKEMGLSHSQTEIARGNCVLRALVARGFLERTRAQNQGKRGGITYVYIQTPASYRFWEHEMESLSLVAAHEQFGLVSKLSRSDRRKRVLSVPLPVAQRELLQQVNRLAAQVALLTEQVQQKQQAAINNNHSGNGHPSTPVIDSDFLERAIGKALLGKLGVPS